MVESLKIKVPEYEKSKVHQDSDIIEIGRKNTGPFLIEEPAISVNMQSPVCAKIGDFEPEEEDAVPAVKTSYKKQKKTYINGRKVTKILKPV